MRSTRQDKEVRKVILQVEKEVPVVVCRRHADWIVSDAKRTHETEINTAPESRMCIEAETAVLNVVKLNGSTPVRI
jgi:hypothetical protein